LSGKRLSGKVIIWETSVKRMLYSAVPLASNISAAYLLIIILVSRVSICVARLCFAFSLHAYYLRLCRAVCDVSFSFCRRRQHL